MANAEPRLRCAAGYVRRFRSNKDQSVSFSVAGQRFVLPATSTFALRVQASRRVLVQYVPPGRKASDVVDVVANPSDRTIREYNAQ
jgi:hypothetical protein